MAGRADVASTECVWTGSARRAFDRMGWARVEFDSTARTTHANGSVRHRPVPHVATTLWCRGAERDDNQGMGMRHTVVLK